MNKQRLSAMADLLEEVAAGTWKPTRSSNGLVAPNTFNIGTWYGKESCGTAACAVGHAAFDKRFPEFDVTSCGSLMIRGDANDQLMWKDVGSVFGIDAKSAIDLFGADSYEMLGETTPDDVAMRIREMLEGE